jgi:hypothetical protein
VQGLESLLLLNLSHNSLSSDFLSQQTFATQLKLVALDLSYNALKTIKVTKKLRKLQVDFCGSMTLWCGSGSGSADPFL